MPSRNMLVLRSFTLLMVFQPVFLEGARILALFPIPSHSHYYHALPYLKRLASLGHEISSVSPFPLKEPMTNIYEILVPEVFENIEETIKSLSAFKGTWKYIEFINTYNLNLAKLVLNNDGVRREILKPGKAKFDLIIVDLWRLDALYGLAAYFEAPIIGIASYGTDWKIDELVGNTSPLPYLQSPGFRWYDLETYGGRLAHFLQHTITWINWRWRHEEKHEALYRKYFPKTAEKQPLSEITRNFALILVNQHFTLAPPRPYVPNVIEVGGMHINQHPKALPKDLEDFIEGAGEHGVIYFSLGTNVRGKNLAKDRQKVLIETFANLSQRVLWKFEDENLPEKPSNVLISNWFPQQDILAHPKVKLFLTHGGLQSTVECIHHGKPMLGLPFYFDQFRNMEHIKRQGLGLVLNYKTMTSVELKNAIIRLLTEKSFDLTARTTAARFRDQPMSPLETAVWWTHYVLRHKGAPHMRVAGRELDFFTYHSLDVLGTFVLVFLVVLAIIVLCVLKVLKTILRRGVDIRKRKQKVR
ncbi:UDP-glucosyltransferase 2-like [Drosophila elegans]|uniref:UDP-glucosyltransferase 2-like n=1 Tax=Drosophila elegans TaxID=30023 RepID=UPI0007E5E812|nr:UDP-glucosyltransferase 2-like [Drosophila elegans]